MTARARFENPEPADDDLTADELQKVLHLQSSILGEAVISDDHAGLLGKLCSLAETFTPNSVATVMLYEAGQRSLYVKSAPSLDEAGIAAFNGLKVGEGSCGNAVFHGEPMYVCNARQDARWENVVELAERFNIFACWSFPVRDEQGEPVGSFAISSFEERKPENFHRVLLQVCTSIVEVILARKAHVEAREQWVIEQLKSRKLESLGVLAGGIAHDFNNLLGAILGNLGLVGLNVPQDSEPTRYLAQAELATQRARDLTQQLLTFSRGGAPIKKPNDIKAVIRESADFVLHGSNVMLKFSGDQSPLLLDIDGGQISQVIQNLVINARQAMPDGGTINVALENANAESLARFNATAGRYLCIRISDTGSGISDDVVDKIFDPYFTTRAEGNGLGLALSYSIVRKHKGYIEVRSEPGAGTEFSIYLPAGAAVKAVDELPASETTQSETRRGLALVMDDDQLMRTTAAAMMQHLGFEVWEAENGTDALEYYRQARATGARIDIAIMDLTVPGDLGGVETMEKVLAEEPDARAIVSSGYSAEQAMSDYTQYGFRAAVAKPYNLRELEAGVSAALEQKGASGAVGLN